MEEDTPFKPSVAELAGRFRGHTIPSPTSNEERILRPRGPCSLKLSTPRDDKEEESEKPVILLPKPFKVRTKNNSVIEQLQANLALSPGSLLPSPRTPEVKPRTACAPSSPPPAPSTPPSSTPPPPPPPTPHARRQSSEEEEVIGFESPPEGTPLPSFNKTRPRLSVKRRPPSRRHRQSLGEEGTGGNGNPSPRQPEPASPGPEGNAAGGEEEAASERTSCDPAALPNRPECGGGGEGHCAQTVGQDAESADCGDADLATLGGPGALEGERQPAASAGILGAAGKVDATTQSAARQEEREMA